MSAESSAPVKTETVGVASLPDPDRAYPGVVWWEGACFCSICGYRCRSVVPIDAEHDAPIVPLECGGCGNASLHPDDE